MIPILYRTYHFHLVKVSKSACPFVDTEYMVGLARRVDEREL
jgi:hypothetical protein